jgi:hypothetical protein
MESAVLTSVYNNHVLVDRFSTVEHLPFHLNMSGKTFSSYTLRQLQSDFSPFQKIHAQMVSNTRKRCQSQRSGRGRDKNKSRDIKLVHLAKGKKPEQSFCVGDQQT